MKNEKKKMRFTSIDLFIIILLTVVAVAFFGKNYLASLLENEKDAIAVTYTISLEGQQAPEGLIAGKELQLVTGEKLGTVVGLHSESSPSATIWYCEGEGKALVRDGGYTFASDLVLMPGMVLSFQCDQVQFNATLVEIKAK